MGTFRFGRNLVLNITNCQGCCKASIDETNTLDSGDTAFIEYETGNYGSDFRSKSPGPDYDMRWYTFTSECKWAYLYNWKLGNQYYCLEYSYISQLSNGKYKVEAVNPNGNIDFTTEFTIGVYNEPFCCKLKKILPFLPCLPGTSSINMEDIINNVSLNNSGIFGQ